ncbi:related to glycosyl hydrolase [Ramularia collo-cygni]|uniref:Related to glycosyl hydrolase n=1 Tax=Ramularia collo-cygni TaxID=112498 RepID=A0A2D3UN41_9PEZI|nr:related to glycosyl hydrolase [Ramularia collo-cygni]CZT14608.1 related to glycosyl hydrolase [Ramularia collo-cygni]
MQNMFWNGSYWPSTIQWIGALIDNIMISTQETLGGLESSDSSYVARSSETQADIQKYYAQTRAYFDSEDTIQIFDAAYDDAQWVVLEWLEAIKFITQYGSTSGSDLGQADIDMYAHRAHIFYNIVQDKFNTTLCEGGINWNPHLEPYKNAITNELFLSSSIAMYLYFPGDTNTDPYPHPDYRTQTNRTLPSLTAVSAHDSVFLDNAVKEYDWFKSHNFTNAQGLVVDGFHISSGQTTCDQRNEMVYTYNQGVLLSGLRGLWESTGTVSYLDDGHNFITTVINATGWNAASESEAAEWAGLGRNGILEDYCDAPANCSQDNYIFKGAYFEHFDAFCKLLPTETPLVDGVTKVAPVSLAELHSNKCKGYESWVRHNAHAALSTRNETNIMGEWWGASYLNKTQSRQSDLAIPPPAGSVDIMNEPWLLNSPIWECSGRGECSILGLRLGSYRKRDHKRQASEGQVRTVETQAQGLSVVRAAADLAMRYP